MPGSPTPTFRGGNQPRRNVLFSITSFFLPSRHCSFLRFAKRGGKPSPGFVTSLWMVGTRKPLPSFVPFWKGPHVRRRSARWLMWRPCVRVQYSAMRGQHCSLPSETGRDLDPPRRISRVISPSVLLSSLGGSFLVCSECKCQKASAGSQRLANPGQTVSVEEERNVSRMQQRCWSHKGAEIRAAGFSTARDSRHDQSQM